MRSRLLREPRRHLSTSSTAMLAWAAQQRWQQQLGIHSSRCLLRRWPVCRSASRSWAVHGVSPRSSSWHLGSNRSAGNDQNRLSHLSAAGRPSQLERWPLWPGHPRPGGTGFIVAVEANRSLCSSTRSRTSPASELSGVPPAPASTSSQVTGVSAAVAAVELRRSRMAGNQRCNRMRATTSCPNAVRIARYIRPVAAMTAAYWRSFNAARVTKISTMVAMVLAAQNQPSIPP